MSNDPNSSSAFAEIVEMIASARERAVQAVNATLIDLYWQVGAYISHKIEKAEWGDGVVRLLAEHLAHTQPGCEGSPPATCFACDNSTRLTGITN